MIRILTVDDHAIVRNGVKILFEERPETATFGEASNAQEAIALVREQDWDVVVMDITLGDRNGIEVMKELKAIRPKLPVLILSMHSEAQFARRAFKAGAAGYITKDSLPDELATAINKVAHGGKYVSPALAERLVMSIDSGIDREPHEELSDREFEIMCLIASGKTVSEIAELLSRSVKTISTYRARILEKMEMRTNAELTHYVIHNKLVE
ncbi:MAG TPA: response regulator transcription factor [Pyrinomonadaceae bacterium]|nr:response regulator transcription factor [Pyrinomonadaceae bacterium]